MDEAIEALTPEARAIGDPIGVALEVGGRTWLLAHGGAAPILDPYRDRMDDQARLKGQVDMGDVFEVGRLMLASNYELTEPEVVEVLASADRQELVEAVMAALFGESAPRRTYTAWMISGLYAAGLDPEAIPARWIPQVLDRLVESKRLVPASEYIESAVAARRLSAIRQRIAVAKPPAEAPPCPA